MIDRPPVTEDELHAYVDGELPADRRAAVGAWLATHPDDMARVAAWRAQIDAIRARYDSVAAEPVPARLALDRLAGQPTCWRSVAAIAADGVARRWRRRRHGGWIARGSIAAAPSDTHVPRRGFTALHGGSDRSLQALCRRSASSGRSARQRCRTSRAMAVEARRLSVARAQSRRVGLKLVGGRLLPGPTGAAAFFMYENASGERYTLYCGRTERRRRRCATTTTRHASRGLLGEATTSPM